MHASAESSNAIHASPAAFMTHLYSLRAAKHSVKVVYAAQVSFFSTQAVYKAFTEQVLPPELRPLH